MSQRDAFNSSIGFVLACTGAAVGLGNLWMFPWRLGAYGGGAFLLLYLLFVYILGTTGLMGEYGLGRWASRGPIGAFDKILRPRGYRFGKVLGAYPVVTHWCILIFYAVVMGWVLRYLVSSLTGGYLAADDMGQYFGQVAGQPVSVLWLGLAILFAVGVTLFGIARGIERVNRFIMPLLLVLFLVLVVRSLTLPGAGAGLRYLFAPEWSQLLRPITWGMALGQAFFSVSLAGGGMVVYGSYARKDLDIPSSALQTVTFDTVVALCAALMIIPAAFAYDIDPAAGPPLLFMTLPEIFSAMPGGYAFGILFFLSVFFATLSSIIGMVEVVVEAIMDQLGWSRTRSVAVVAGSALLCGLPFAVNMALFEGFVDLITVYIAPAGAVLAAFLFFWVHGVEKARTEINIGAAHRVGAWWNPVAKYVFVGIAALIVLLQIAFRIG